LPYQYTLIVGNPVTSNLRALLTLSAEAVKLTVDSEASANEDVLDCPTIVTVPPTFFINPIISHSFTSPFEVFFALFFY